MIVEEVDNATDARLSGCKQDNQGEHEKEDEENKDECGGEERERRQKGRKSWKERTNFTWSVAQVSPNRSFISPGLMFL